MTATTPNLSWLAKIERADENIKNLASELDGFLRLNSNHYRSVTERKEDTREFVLKAYGDPLEIPSRLQVLAGEIIYHLRTSLDHLVWALVSRKHGNPSWRTQFPICDTAEKYQKACKDGIIKGISASTAQIVDAVQPYRSHEPRNHALFVLNRLSNVDKHRLLIVAYGAISSANQIAIDPGGPDVGIAGITPPGFVLPSKDGTEVSRVTFTKLHPNTNVEFKAPALVVFKEFGASNLEAVIPGLVQLRDAVMNTIKLFDKEL